jgi:basic membrane protein A
MLSTNADKSIYLDTIKSAAQNYDVIFLIPGYFYDVELKEVMAQYPDKTFVYFDGATDIEGCYSVTFAQNEGAFLAGVLSALLTQDTSVKMINPDKIVGFVGGADMPVIHSYQVGFEQGVAYADPDVKVIARYAGSHYDAALGKVTAYNTFSEGADVIFQAAGPTGLGVLEAAKEYGFVAIGVDTDQGYLQPDFIASSMLKRVDTAVYDMIKQFCEDPDNMQPVSRYDVANGGISMADNEYYQKMVPTEIQNKVKEAADAIANGDIKVNDYNQ